MCWRKNHALEYARYLYLFMFITGKVDGTEMQKKSHKTDSPTIRGFSNDNVPAMMRRTLRDPRAKMDVAIEDLQEACLLFLST